MQRRVWVLAAATAALVACGGEEFTVADDPGPDESAAPIGVNTDCNGSRDCVLVARECCGSCAEALLTQDDVIAMHRNAVLGYREAVCGADDWACLQDCDDTVNPPAIGVDCRDDTETCVVERNP